MQPGANLVIECFSTMMLQKTVRSSVGPFYSSCEAITENFTEYFQTFKNISKKMKIFCSVQVPTSNPSIFALSYFLFLLLEQNFPPKQTQAM